MEPWFAKLHDTLPLRQWPRGTAGLIFVGGASIATCIYWWWGTEVWLKWIKTAVLKPADNAIDRATSQVARTKLVPRKVATGGRKLAISDIEVLEHNEEYLVFNKPYDCRLDGESEEPTVEVAARHADPKLDKIRFAHQLDYATSGVLVLARTKAAAKDAGQCFEQRRAVKHYLALAYGHFAEDRPCRIEGAIAAIEGDFRMFIAKERPEEGYGKHGGPAATLILCIGRGEVAGKPASVFVLRPLTGRRHQLRLHLAGIGCPIIGDATYAASDMEDRCTERMMLHAWRLELPLRSGTKVFKTQEPFSQYMPGRWTEKLEMAVQALASDGPDPPVYRL